MHTRSLSGHAASEPNPFPNQPPAPTAGWLFAQAIQGRPVTDDSIRAAGFSTQSDRRGNAPQRSESWYIAQRLLGKPIPAEPRVERGPSQSWLIAQQLLGKPVLAPDPALAAQAAEECRKYREFVAAITGVNESIAWDPGKHPRGHFSQNRGWFSPKGTGGSTSGGAADSTGAGGLGDASSAPGGEKRVQTMPNVAQGAGGGHPQRPAATSLPDSTGRALASRSTLKSNSTNAPNAAAIWNGAVKSAKHMKLPPVLLEWNAKHETPVSIGDIPKYTPKSMFGLLGGTMKLDELSVQRLDRIGRAKGFDPNDKAVLGNVYNEAFHAWFDGEGKSLGWLSPIMSSQKQFVDEVAEKAEEAMSETVNQVINDLEDGRGVLTYDELMTLKPTDERRQNLTPGHNESKQKWENDVGAGKEMSEELYYATVWIMFNGSKDPAPKGGNRLEALKRFFAKQFHPEWSAKQVDSFAKSRYKAKK